VLTMQDEAVPLRGEKMKLSPQTRKIILTGAVAAVGAIFADHLLKPNLKRGLKL
jgi:hypothetical protein